VKLSIDIQVNGERYQEEVEPRTTLLEFLRQTLHLTGTKEGCGLGDCGTCIVLLDEKPVNSCLVLAVDANGRRVTTIEGLAEDGKLHPVQQSFIDNGAVQCGFCTPAMILTTKALLDKNPDPAEGEIKQALGGILCRCGSYQKILNSVLAVGKGERE
jgi:carbon-monoxide dehydrogenase small subunit